MMGIVNGLSPPKTDKTNSSTYRQETVARLVSNNQPIASTWS